MSHAIATLKPLFLSEDETLALLDLCLMSAVEIDSLQERVVLKVTDLARRYLADDIAGEALAMDSMLNPLPCQAVCVSHAAPMEIPTRSVSKPANVRWSYRRSVDRSLA